MPTDDDVDLEIDDQEGDGGGTQDQLPSLDERLDAFLYFRTGKRHDDPRAALQDSTIRAGMEAAADSLLAELDERARQEAEAAAEAERKRLEADDEALKAKILQERAAARAEHEREARESERRARLEAAIDAEERAAAGPDATPLDEQHVAVIEEAHDLYEQWKQGKVPPEEMHEAAQRAIAASVQYKPEAPFKVDRKALDAAVAEKLKGE